LRRYPYDDLVTNLRFEGVARPPYLIDRADMPRRMLFQSPYGPVLTPLGYVRVDQRGITHPEPAYYTLYRIDWVAFDRMEGGVRQAALVETPAFARSEEQLSRVGPAFSVRFGNDVGMLLDTARETYTIDLVRGPDTTIAMSWSSAQLDTLRQAAVELRLLEVSAPHPAIDSCPDGMHRTMSPAFSHTLDVVMDGRQKHFAWGDNSDAAGTKRDPAEWERLLEFARRVRAMVARHPAMANAPRARGVYL
jgi:hypothetical protein